MTVEIVFSKMKGFFGYLHLYSRSKKQEFKKRLFEHVSILDLRLF